MNCYKLWAKPRMKTVPFSKKSSWMFGTHSRTKGWEVHDQLQQFLFGLSSKAADKQLNQYNIFLDLYTSTVTMHAYLYISIHIICMHMHIRCTYISVSLSLYTNIAPVARRSLSQLICWNRKCRLLTTSHLVLNCFFHCFQVSWFGHHRHHLENSENSYSFLQIHKGNYVLSRLTMVNQFCSSWLYHSKGRVACNWVS